MTIAQPEAQLKRSLGLPLLTLYGLGTILGAGIYVLIGEVAAAAGMYSPVSFIVAGILAGFSAFTFAELSSRYPQSAGEAVYIKTAFANNWLSALTGWLVCAIGLVSAATVVNGFTGYLSVFIDIPGWLVIVLLVLMLGILACWGIAESVGVAALITCIEIAGLVMVMVLAREHLYAIPEHAAAMIPPFEKNAWLSVTLGSFLAFYAFIGFEDMVNVAEEVKNPVSTMPKAIISALLVSSVLYVLVACIAVLSLPINQLQGAAAPMTVILSGYSDKAGKIIAVISMVAMINGALIQMIMAARVLYGMARNRLAPVLLGVVAKKTRTPVIATVVVTWLVGLLALAFPLLLLAKITSFIVLVIFTLVNAALVVIKIRKIPHQGIRVPLWVPVAGGLLSFFFLLMQLR